MQPPKENPEAVTDEDSDKSDNEAGHINHLPRRLLQAPAEIRDTFHEDNDPDPIPDKEEKTWTKQNPHKIGSNVQEAVPNWLSQNDQDDVDSCSTAFDFYKLFQTDGFVQEILEQSKLYGQQRGYNVSKINEDNFRCTEALLLYSGYDGPPQRRMVWQLKQDCHHPFIAENIQRDEVESILKCLHFRDNSAINDDGYYKVRPIFQSLNKGDRFFTVDTSYSVDECMIPYFGKHFSKQYISNKPVKY